jgi:hypothetical protein
VFSGSAVSCPWWLGIVVGWPEELFQSISFYSVLQRLNGFICALSLQQSEGFCFLGVAVLHLTVKCGLLTYYSSQSLQKHLKLQEKKNLLYDRDGWHSMTKKKVISLVVSIFDRAMVQHLWTF